MQITDCLVVVCNLIAEGDVIGLRHYDYFISFGDRL